MWSSKGSLSSVSASPETCLCEGSPEELDLWGWLASVKSSPRPRLSRWTEWSARKDGPRLSIVLERLPGEPEKSMVTLLASFWDIMCSSPWDREEDLVSWTDGRTVSSEQLGMSFGLLEYLPLDWQSVFYIGRLMTQWSKHIQVWYSHQSHRWRCKVDRSMGAQKKERQGNRRV